MSIPSVNACLNILQKTPTEEIEQNLPALAVFLSTDQDAVEELFQRVDTPLGEDSDPHVKGKKFLLCDHNRDGESYRSPWSNKYHPPFSGDDYEGFKPSLKLREMELFANEVFGSYCELYYGKDAISSVYLWDRTDESNNSNFSGGFNGCFLIKKAFVDQNKDLKCDSWNSIHIVEVGGVSGGKVLYKLSTTVIVSVHPLPSGRSDNIDIGGSLVRRMEKNYPVGNGDSGNMSNHITNIGKMVEEMEIGIRSNMDALYIQKTREVIESIRSSDDSKKKLGAMAQLMNEAKMSLK